MNNERDRETNTAAAHEDSELSALYQHSRKAEPPGELDGIILAASRREVNAGPRPASPFSGRWQVPASIAAVLVITIILVPLMVSDPEMQQDAQEVAPMQDEHMEETAVPVIEPADIPVPARKARPSEPGLHHDAIVGGVASGLGKKEAQVREVAPAAGLVQSYGRMETGEISDEGVPAPALWLQRIWELVDKGEMMTAARELEAFRQAYPDHPVDPDLREELGLQVQP